MAQVAGEDPVPVPFAGDQVIRVTVQTQEQLRIVTTLADNVWNCRSGVGPMDLQVSPQKLPALIQWADQQNLPHEVLIPDVKALLDAEREQIRIANLQRNVDWFATYHPITEINTRLDELAAESGGTATVFTAGQSLEGRPIKGIRFSAPDLPGNPRANRPQVMFEGAQHAREWISPCVNMWIADRMIETYATDARVRAVVDHFEVVVVPVINVDGYAYTWIPANRLWRKNRRNNGDGSFGVDLNRNWGYQWGGQGASTAPNNDTYRGTAGFSEPETQVMRDFITSLPRLKAHIDFHSYSQLVLSPFGYTGSLCPDNALFVMLNANMTGGIFSINGKLYNSGPSYTAIYPASGVVPDWVYGDRGVLAWTIELRDTGQTGFVLPADQIVPTAMENFEAVLRLCEYVRDNQLWMSLPDGSPERLIAGTPRSIRLNVKNGEGMLLPGSVRLHTREGSTGDFTSTAMALESGYTFIGMLPGAACGISVEYRFSAATAHGETIWFPSSQTALNAPISQRFVSFDDSMETDLGWAVGAAGDIATTGLWERADPQATAAQPENDASPVGVLCWITDGRSGSSSGQYDIDGGSTTLTSPLFSALPPPATRVSGTYLTYSRWYSNNTGTGANSDSMPISISRDNGATWVLLEDCTQNAAAWVRKQFRIQDFVSPSASMRLRFVARDLGTGSIVEAGVDDVLVEVFGCARSGDFNQDGGVDGRDVEAFFLAWEAGEPDADFDENGGVDGGDIEEFFLAWERG